MSMIFLRQCFIGMKDSKLEVQIKLKSLAHLKGNITHSSCNEMSKDPP
jgi:hypothetical protein